MKNLIGHLLPLFGSIFLVPIFYDKPLIFPLICVLLSLCDLKPRWKSSEIIILISMTAFSIFMFTHSFFKGLSLLSTVISVFIVLNFKDRDYKFSLALTFVFHVVLVLISFVSLIYLGYDYFPDLIFGESRHLVHNNDIASFRVSGIYREPSNLGLSMLLLAMWGHQMTSTRATNFLCLVFLGIAILSYSSVSILALVYILYTFKSVLFKAKYLFFLVPTFVFISIPVVNFFIDKFLIYQSNGLENATRFLIISSGLGSGNNYSWIFGAEAKLLKDYVVLDLGPILSTAIIFGVCGLIPLIYFIMNAGFSMRLVILSLTKVTLTHPLIWFVVLYKKREKIKGKNDHIRGAKS